MKNANKINLNNSNLDYNTMNISSLDEGVEDTSRVISTSRKHKKQETTHFNEHKKGNKSTKKEEKETRDNLKVKIGVLADKLYRTKKITKALYNKMYNVSMGAGRLNTLRTTFQNLREFKNAETIVKKNQFNQTLKQTKEGKKTLNTVYIKYLEWSGVQDVRASYLDKKDEINENIYNKTGKWGKMSDWSEEQKKEYLILREKHETFTVKGDESDIRKAIKEFISFAIKLPYVLQIDILRVTINKEDKDDQYYRWQGAEKTEDTGIIYMKAWQCKFVHHGFNVDKNDETKFECVPNALFKMYGNRDAGRSKFIAPIADNGIDYVKQILDDDNVKTDNSLDENIESNNNHNNIEVRPNLDKYLDVIQEYTAELEDSKLNKIEKEFYTTAINDINYIYPMLKMRL